MDQAIIDLAAKVMTIILPFVSKGAEEFVSKAGEDAYEKAKSLLSTLRRKWSSDQEATETLVLFETKPERYKVVLEDILQEKLDQDQELVSYVKQIIQKLEPTLDIIQHFEEGKGITGLKVGEMRSGKARISQEITNAEDVIGAEFETLG